MLNRAAGGDEIGWSPWTDHMDVYFFLKSAQFTLNTITRLEIKEG
jgi:hypothetical protein